MIDIYASADHGDNMYTKAQALARVMRAVPRQYAPHVAEVTTASGYWLGTSEITVVLTVAASPEVDIDTLAGTLAEDLHQDYVLVAPHGAKRHTYTQLDDMATVDAYTRREGMGQPAYRYVPGGGAYLVDGMWNAHPVI